jgi:hypothetical protein
MKSFVFWDIKLCDTVKVNRSFGGKPPPSSGLKRMSSKKRALLVSCILLVSCLAFFSALKVGAICSSETSDDFHPITRRYIREDRTLSPFILKLRTSTYPNVHIQFHKVCLLRSNVLMSIVIGNVTPCSTVSLLLARVGSVWALAHAFTWIRFSTGGLFRLPLGSCLLDLLFNPEDGGSTFFRNVCKLLRSYTSSHLIT